METSFCVFQQDAAKLLLFLILGERRIVLLHLCNPLSAVSFTTFITDAACFSSL